MRDVGLGGPFVLPYGIAVVADFERLFVVGSLFAESSDFSGGGGLGYSLASFGDVAAVGTGVLPCQLVFFVNGELEEFRRLGKGRVDLGGRDAMIAEVGEAGGFEGLGELVGCACSISVGSVGVDKGRTVDDGDDKVWRSALCCECSLRRERTRGAIGSARIGVGCDPEGKGCSISANCGEA